MRWGFGRGWGLVGESWWVGRWEGGGEGWRAFVGEIEIAEIFGER